MAKSILHPEIHGVCFVGGRRGVGKSYFASQADNPKNTIFIDYEEKGTGIHEQLGFGIYKSIISNVYQETLSLIDSIEKDKYTVVVFDNVSYLEDAMKAEASSKAQVYAKEFGLNAGNIISGRFGGASAVVNKLISAKITMPLYQKGVRLIIGTAHAKPFWGSGGPIPNKWNILGADRWQDLSIISLILVEGDYQPIPSAIVKKEQLGSIRFNEEKEEFETGRRLPFRLPKANFFSITNYLDNPADLDNPAKGEVPNKAEMAAYSDELTDEQLQMNRMSLEIQQTEIKRQEDEERAFLDSQLEGAKKLTLELAQGFNGMPAPMVIPQIITKVQEQYPNITEKDLSEMLKGA